jgi:ABC-type multidrug transport system ATPase subunit
LRKGKVIKEESNMLKIHRLKKIYGTDEIQTTALNNINLEIGEGEFIAVMGPSGWANPPCCMSWA